MDLGLGAYGSDEEDASQPMEEDQKGLVTLLGADKNDDSEDSDLGLSHLTAARHPADSTPGAAQQQQQAPAAPRLAASGAAATTPERANGDQPGPEQQLGDHAQPPPGAHDLGLGGADASSADNWLPEELREPPAGQCDPALQARVANWLHLQRTRGRFINQELRKSRGYRNPEFFQKMIEHLEIDQYGTAFAPEVFDPHNLPREDYLDALQKQWQEEAERRQKERTAAGRIEFTKSASQPNLAGGAPAVGGLQPQATAAAAAAAQAAAASLSLAHNPLMPGLGVAGGGPVTAAQLAQAQQQYQNYMMQMQQMQRQQQAAIAATAGSGAPAATAAAALAAAQVKAAQLAAQAAKAAPR